MLTTAFLWEQFVLIPVFFPPLILESLMGISSNLSLCQRSSVLVGKRGCGQLTCFGTKNRQLWKNYHLLSVDLNRVSRHFLLVFNPMSSHLEQGKISECFADFVRKVWVFSRTSSLPPLPQMTHHRCLKRDRQILN